MTDNLEAEARRVAGIAGSTAIISRNCPLSEIADRRQPRLRGQARGVMMAGADVAVKRVLEAGV